MGLWRNRGYVWEYLQHFGDKKPAVFFWMISTRIISSDPRPEILLWQSISGIHAHILSELHDPCHPRIFSCTMRWFWRQGRYDIFCSSISWYVCNVAHTMTYGMYGLTQVVTYLCCHDEDLNCHIGQFFPPRTEVHLDQSKCQLKWSNSAPEIHGQPHVPRTQTHTHTLCEPAQSKCIWRFHKSNFIQKFTGEMPAPRMSPERRHTLCASLRGRNARGNFTRATLYRNLKEKCLCPEWTQNADTHFVQACAVERHLETLQEPLYTNIYR